MTQKVRLPREVAGAIEEARKDMFYAEHILVHACNPDNREQGEHWGTLNDFIAESKDGIFKIADALRYGYEIEPEPITVTVTAKQMDHIRLVYSYDADLPSSHERSYSDGVRFGVRRTLDHLGVEIPGVNAPATSSKKSG